MSAFELFLSHLVCSWFACGCIMTTFWPVSRLSQTCNHVAALLFKVEAAFRLGQSNPACTSERCSWAGPKGKNVSLNIKVADMAFCKPVFAKKTSSGSTHIPCHFAYAEMQMLHVFTFTEALHSQSLAGEFRKLSKTREVLVEDSDPQCFRELVRGLKEAIPDCSLFLPGESFILWSLDTQTAIYC